MNFMMRLGVVILCKEGLLWDLGEGCVDVVGSEVEMGENGFYVGVIEGID